MLEETELKIEEEVKILGIDPEKLRRRLIALGAKLKFKGVIHEVAFISPRLKRQDVTLRLRTVNGRNELTVKTDKTKKASSRLLVRKEHEIEVSDFNEATLLLEALGFSKFRDREKEREEWILGETKIEIDRYPGFPHYAEIEGKDEETIVATIRKLGISRCLRVAKSSTALLRKWGAKDPNHIKF